MVETMLYHAQNNNIHQAHAQQQQQQQQQLSGITNVLPNDIICGRGGLPLKHPGNMSYRQLVSLNKELYATCLKTEKVRISKSIVAAIRESNARFLEREDGKISSSLGEVDDYGNLVTWRDIGDKRAIEKTSQALREGQPKLLKKLAERQEKEKLKGGGQGVQEPVKDAPASESASEKPPQSGGESSGLLKTEDVFSRSTFDANNVLLQAGQQQRAPSSNNLADPRADSRHDSWGDADPSPLPDMMLDASDHRPLPHNGKQHVFSNDEQEQLMTCLSISGRDGDEEEEQQKIHAQKLLDQLEKKRTSVKFMRLPSHLSDLSVFSDVHSLDSALDAAERELEFEMLGEYDNDFEDNMSIGMGGSFDILHRGSMSSGMFGLDTSHRSHNSNLNGTNNMAVASSPDHQQQQHQPMPRRSILRKSNKWSMQAAAAAAAMHNPAPMVNHSADPGMIFTSTMDTTPGGINSGTDISGLVTGERRKSVVAFEMDVNRRRSSRMSMCSQLSEVQRMFARDMGSMVSLQSAGFRDLIEDIMDDSDEDEENDNKHQQQQQENGHNASVRQTV